jgi:hypothetical protein
MPTRLLPPFNAYKPFIDADQNGDKTLREGFQKLEGEMEAESERRKVSKSQIVPNEPAQPWAGMSAE